MRQSAYLFISNGEFALSFLVVGRKVLQLVDGVVRSDRHGKLDIAFGVLVAGLPRFDQSGTTQHISARAQHT